MVSEFRPQTWKNKKTKRIYQVVPMLFPLQITFDERLLKKLEPDLIKLCGKRKVVSGVLYQEGWLIENEHDVWIGLPMSAEKHFIKIKKRKA